MIIKKTIVTETITEYKKAEIGEKRPARLYTVGERDWKPQIRLSGHWLEDVGFCVGDKMMVSVRENQLVLEKMVESEDD